MYAMYAAWALGALVMILWLTAAWVAFTDEEPNHGTELPLPNDQKAA